MRKTEVATTSWAEIEEGMTKKKKESWISN